MYFCTFIALLAATSLAMPITSPMDQMIYDIPTMDDLSHEPSYKVVARAARSSCNLWKCAAALGTMGVGCVAAAAQRFREPIIDGMCVTISLNNVENKPTSCIGCSSRF